MTILSSASQQPIFSYIAVPTPSPGSVNYSATVPVGQQWKIRTLCVQLVTNATIGNRTLFIIAQGSAFGNRLGTVFSTILQPSSKTYEYSFSSAGFVNDILDNALGFATLGMPEFILPPGGLIAVGGFGVQPSDQFQSLVVGIEITYPYKI